MSCVQLLLVRAHISENSELGYVQLGNSQREHKCREYSRPVGYAALKFRIEYSARNKIRGSHLHQNDHWNFESTWGEASMDKKSKRD